MKTVTKSWRTTLAAVLAFLVLLLTAGHAQFDADPATVAEWGVVVAAIPAVVGLFLARDHSVTSKEAGAE